jgi:hypothetical protein
MSHTLGRPMSALPFPGGDHVDLPADGVDRATACSGAVLKRAFDGKSYGDAPGS